MQACHFSKEMSDGGTARSRLLASAGRRLAAKRAESDRVLHASWPEHQIIPPLADQTATGCDNGIRHIRPQYACRACDTISAATIPAAIIDGGMAAPGLLTWVVICKYVDHLPLYRLEHIAARQGVTLASSTLADWIGRIGVAAWVAIATEC